MATILRYWSVIAGIVAMLGIAVRISYQLGGIKQSFTDHMERSRTAHSDIWKQLDWLRDRRR